MAQGIDSSFSSVISVNPYENTYKHTLSHYISDVEKPEYLKTQYAISYINAKHFITTKIQISKNIPQEDVDDAIHNLVYHELALDQAIEYKVRYIENFQALDEEDRHFNVFVLDPQEIDATFSEVTKQIKYLDVIIPTPLLFKSLYTNNIIENNGVHCFVYFQESDAFITIYKDKEYVYTKSLEYSLEYMHERFCELYGEQISYKDFISFISTKNFKNSDNDYVEYLLKLYKEIFGKISEILTFIKRAYEIEKIDHIYIDSQISTVSKLYELVEVELNIRSSFFDFDFDLKSDKRYVDHLHALMQIYVEDDPKKRYNCNFTLYERPPKFIKRESGKVIMLVAASLVVAFAYPIAYWALTILQIEQLSSLNKEYDNLHQVKIKRYIDISKREKNLKQALELLKAETFNFTSKKNTLIKIHKVQVGYPMKAKILAGFTQDLNLYDVYLEAISYTESKTGRVFTMNLVAQDDKKITNLLKYFLAKYDGKYSFSFKEIYFDEITQKYFSELKVEIL